MRTRLLALVLVAACGGSNPAPEAAADTTAATPPSAAPAATPPDTSVTAGAPAPTGAPATMSGLRGKVVASGTENMNLTTLQGVPGSMVVLRGNLEQELRALAGATVQVDGNTTTENNRRIVDVQKYEIVDINGEKPIVGTLVQPQKLATATDTLDVVGEVKAAPGSKVWITGDRSGKQLKVRSYGVIR